MSNYLPVRADWLALNQEDALEPTLPIVDAHHHFYDRPGWRYLRDDYLEDVGSGHNICASVYMQALTRYRSAGAEIFQPVGETEYVVASTETCAAAGTQVAAGIVGHANLRLGAEVRAVLEAHIEAGRGRFRGVRHLSTWDVDPALVNPLSAAPKGLLLDRKYRAGAAQLGALGLTYDAWMFFHQLPELRGLAQAIPDVPVIVNHCGGIVRIGAYAARDDEIFVEWSKSMRELAALPNVYVKLGGLGMRINGFDFEKAKAPPSSLQLAACWRPWIHTVIEVFGARRCMFESNFPVDKGSYGFVNGWNAFKRLCTDASTDERNALFAETARRVYRLG